MIFVIQETFKDKYKNTKIHLLFCILDSFTGLNIQLEFKIYKIGTVKTSLSIVTNYSSVNNIGDR